MHNDELSLERLPEQIISGALFDFAAQLTVELPFLDAAVVVDILVAFAKERGLSLDDAEVLTWHLQSLPQVLPEPLPETDARIIDMADLRPKKRVRRPKV